MNNCILYILLLILILLVITKLVCTKINALNKKVTAALIVILVLVCVFNPIKEGFQNVTSGEPVIGPGGGDVVVGAVDVRGQRPANRTSLSRPSIIESTAPTETPIKARRSSHLERRREHPMLVSRAVRQRPVEHQRTGDGEQDAADNEENNSRVGAGEVATAVGILGQEQHGADKESQTTKSHLNYKQPNIHTHSYVHSHTPHSSHHNNIHPRIHLSPNSKSVTDPPRQLIRRQLIRGDSLTY